MVGEKYQLVSDANTSNGGAVGEAFGIGGPRSRRLAGAAAEAHRPRAVMVGPLRTPIGRAGKGSLKSVRADDLAAVPLKALLERNPQLETGGLVVDVVLGWGVC